MATKKYVWKFDLEEYLMTKDVKEDFAAKVKPIQTFYMADVARLIAEERTEYRIDDYQQNYFVIDSLDGLLQQTVETDFVDEQNFRGEKELELLVQTIVGKACEEFFEHGGGGNIAAAKVLPATDEKQGLGDMTFTGAGVAGEDKPLPAPGKFQGGQFHDLSFIDTLLKVKVEIGQEFSVGQFGLPDPPFGPALGPGIVFKGYQTMEKFTHGSGLRRGPAEFVVEDGSDAMQPQFEKELFEPGWVFAHGFSPFWHVEPSS